MRTCPIHKTKMLRKFNSTLFICLECEIEKENKRVKRKPRKKESKPRKKTTPGRTINKKLDEAWSELVKLRAGGRCEYCGTTKALNSHHIYSRGNQTVKWDVENGVCLCVGHHVGIRFSAHKTPMDFAPWLIKHRGEDKVNMLKYKSKQTSHMTIFEKELLLEELKKEIKELKNAG